MRSSALFIICKLHVVVCVDAALRGGRRPRFKLLEYRISDDSHKMLVHIYDDDVVIFVFKLKLYSNKYQYWYIEYLHIHLVQKIKYKKDIAVYKLTNTLFRLTHSICQKFLVYRSNILKIVSEYFYLSYLVYNGANFVYQNI